MPEDELEPEMATESVENSYDDDSNTSGETVEVAAQQQESAQDHNWRQANETLSHMKNENSLLREQLQALQAQVSGLGQVHQAPKEQDFFAGRESNDFAEIADVQRYVNHALQKKEQAMQAKEQELQSKLDMMQVQAKDPDFKKKIETYRDHLTASQKQAIMQSATPWSDAYEAVINSAAYYKDQLSQASNPSAQRIANNMSKPGSVAGLGSSASLNRASQWENMSDAEIIAMGDSYAMGGR